MNTEQFIKDSAAKGWSQTMTRKALDLSSYKFRQILSVMPPMDWIGRGLSPDSLRATSTRVTTPAMLEALDRSHARRKREATHTWGKYSGTVEELAEHAVVSARTIRRRLKQGKTIAEACSTPPSINQPRAERPRA